MNKPIILIIILLAGLFIIQIFMEEPAVQPVNNISSSVSETIKRKQTPEKQVSRTSRSRGEVRQTVKKIIFPEDTGETIEEHNAKLVQETGFTETWDVTPEQAAASNVSQAQMDYVRKRELAVQRRDYLIERRAENIKRLAEENAITKQ